MNEENEIPKSVEKKYVLPVSIVIATIILAGALVYTAGRTHPEDKAPQSTATVTVGTGGAVLSVRWGDLGAQMVREGVIDKTQFEALYASRGGLSPDMEAMLNGSDNGQIKLTPQNPSVILNLLWAFGLGNKNPILENGPMKNPQYGGAGNFASTGGWTLSEGSAMNHYSAHSFVTLTADQQALVEEVSKNIYRPCCGNSTYFPDCNHGMAMLGLLELMASQGATEDQMYKTALIANSYWFPNEYQTMARYLAAKGVDWNSVDPKDVLAANFSSAQGYGQILQAVQPVPNNSGNSCGA